MASSYSVNLPQQRFKAEQVKENEALVAQKHGIEMYQLMLDAGTAVFDLIVDSYQTSKLLVLCGYGNNGGDGYVVARLGLEKGWAIELVQVGQIAKLQGDALNAYQDYLQAGGQPPLEFNHEEMIKDLQFGQDIVVVDALLGTGIRGAVREPMASLISWVNQQQHLAVVSIDVPSGLNSDTGAVANVAIKADKTCTFIGVKQGLSTGLGPDHTGRLYYADLSIGDAFAAGVEASSWCVNQSLLQQALPKRALAAHKGSCGHVLLIGSDKGMSGAIRLAGRACLRTGAGLVSVLTHVDNEVVVAGDCAELMVSGVDSETDIRPWLERVDVIAIGPGLGGSSWGQSMLNQVLSYLKRHNKPCVVDADGLNILATLKFYPRFDINNTVITPHPLEAARILGCQTIDVQHNRFDAAQDLTEATGAVALLKGVGTVINIGELDDNPCQYINPTGNPGMATAGMGDVLTGVIAGLMAQGMNASDAAIFGAYIHGGAADLGAAEGERGMMASDVLAHIRQMVN